MKLSLAAPVAAEIEIKKSRFLARVEPVAGKAAVQARLNELRDQHPDARHLCFAFLAGGDSGMSDDGEPSGTAGKPIFNVLGHKGLDDVLAVVVRYFGGVKLGAGGLARAYGAAVSSALDGADTVTVEPWRELELTLPFALESEVRRLLARTGVAPASVDYGEVVRLTVSLPQSRIADFSAAFRALAPADPVLALRH